ncbi:MAG: hypothetical protein M0R51_18305, partial [Clostridia bacterium]|nr:hypothetical protein [Clostridia bacterium]
MSTNFYVKGHIGNDNPKYHIGKRSAAGMYCYDCGITLCKGGESKVHFGTDEWYEECPNCGKKPENEDLEHSASGKELGFNNMSGVIKTGVKSCCSFTWARNIGKVKHIVDEYGRE